MGAILAGSGSSGEGTGKRGHEMTTLTSTKTMHSRQPNLDQLRHKSALMTMRYLKTLSADESLKIQQAVEYQW